jgi:serine/threonine protein kinase
VAVEALEPGSKLQRFTLIRRIALGGMAEIWLAHEKTADGREAQVALKVLLAPYAKDPAFRSMFADEVQIASRLTHENIVQVHGSFEVGGHLIQAMELVDGKDLRRILSALVRQRQRFPIPLALVVAREMARALSYAHTKRREDGKPLEIVHRDISPHNVMITYGGGVKLLDFGIAKAAERLTKTRTGVIKGKIAYMAPEQAIGAEVTAKTDIFAMGIVLWEMLALQRLFKADSDALVMNRVIHADVPPIKDYNPDVPNDVVLLLKQMLAQRAVMRPESARAVENALTRIILRHYREEESSPEALSAWAVQFMDDDKGTGKLMAPELVPADLTLPDAQGESVLASTTISDASPAAVELEQGPTDDTESTALDLDAKTIATPIEDRSTDPLRLPTRSEIQRAVDAQPTMPISIDDAPKAPGRTLLKIRDPARTEALIIPEDRPAVQTPMSTPMSLRSPVSSASLEAASLGEPSTPEVPRPAPAVIATPEPMPAVRDEAHAAEADARFEPMRIALEAEAHRPSPSISLSPLTSPPSAPAAHGGDPVKALRTVLLLGGAVAIIAIGIAIGALVRSC